MYAVHYVLTRNACLAFWKYFLKSRGFWHFLDIVLYLQFGFFEPLFGFFKKKTFDSPVLNLATIFFQPLPPPFQTPWGTLTGWTGGTVLAPSPASCPSLPCRRRPHGGRSGTPTSSSSSPYSTPWQRWTRKFARTFLLQRRKVISLFL